MKSYIPAAFILLTSVCLLAKKPITPPKDADSGKYCYQEVVQIENTKSGDLYARAREWAAKAYRSAKDVIQFEDKERGILVLKGIFKVSWFGSAVNIHHTLTIEVKDGRYRYTLTDFIYQSGNGPEIPLEKMSTVNKKLFKRIDETCRMTIDELKQAMSSANSVGSSNW